MVVDTSALTAILRSEPDRQAFLDALATAPVRLVSSVTSLEAHMVLEGRYGPEAGADLELFLYTAEIRIIPFDARQSEIAKMAWREYGKGNPADLNPGDCCVYALAKAQGEPVLCKGNDFPRTDIQVVQPHLGSSS